MSWWGKVLGGTIGFMLGGPLGAMMGASFGHNFDRGAGGSYQNDSTINVEKIQSAFFTATFSMAGYMAKADGKVSRDEIAVIDSVMQQMRLTPQQKTVAISLFEKGKQADFPLMEVLQQFRFECHRRRNLLQMFLEISHVCHALFSTMTNVDFDSARFSSTIKKTVEVCVVFLSTCQFHNTVIFLDACLCCPLLISCVKPPARFMLPLQRLPTSRS